MDLVTVTGTENIMMAAALAHGTTIIDNAAHLGGLLSGAALAGVIGYKRPGQAASVTMAWRILQIICLLVILVAFFMVARRFDITW